MRVVLAQLPDPGSAYSLGWLALGLLALIGGAKLVVDLINGIKRMRGTAPTPQPFIVRSDAEYIQRPEYDRDRKELREELARHARNRKEHYEKVEALSCEIASLKTATNLQSAQIHTIDGKVDRVLDRLPKPTT
ncbi:MAG: hypothetical protein ACREIA_15125 [Opitutaceae bacterium]